LRIEIHGKGKSANGETANQSRHLTVEAPRTSDLAPGSSYLKVFTLALHK